MAHPLQSCRTPSNPVAPPPILLGHSPTLAHPLRPSWTPTNAVGPLSNPVAPPPILLGHSPTLAHPLRSSWTLYPFYTCPPHAYLHTVPPNCPPHAYADAAPLERDRRALPGRHRWRRPGYGGAAGDGCVRTCRRGGYACASGGRPKAGQPGAEVVRSAADARGGVRRWRCGEARGCVRRRCTTTSGGAAAFPCSAIAFLPPSFHLPATSCPLALDALQRHQRVT
eukprot:364686-Chlamydomonas_euryale.AAC.7